MASKHTYSMQIHAVCPVDGSSDCYELTIENNGRPFAVEKLRGLVAEATDEPHFQEEITRRIATGLTDIITTFSKIEVRTEGWHKGVKIISEFTLE